MEHSDNFCAFFVDSYGVEVIDLDVGRGANRMAHRSGVFWKLKGSQLVDIVDPFDRSNSGPR